MSTYRFFTQLSRKGVICVYRQNAEQYCALTWRRSYNNNGSKPVQNNVLFKRIWTHSDNVWRRNELTQPRWFSTNSSPDRAGKSESKSASAAVAENDIFGETSKLGLFAKFKLMYKKYWYVMVPVHCITSCFWFGGFYYMSKSGVDVPSIMQSLHMSEAIIERMQNSEMGHLAVAYLCYKVATPLRYALTLGGTTISIKYLVQEGHIKPMPSKEQFLQMYEQKMADRAAAKAGKDHTQEEQQKNKK